MNVIGKALKFLNSIPNINSGGCGIAALAMYRYLKKNKLLPKDFKILFLYNNNCKSLYDANRKGGNFGANHIVFWFNGNLYDTDGLFEIEYTDYKYILPASIKKLLAALNDDNGWNPMFKREKQIPKIERRLKINLSDVSCNNYSISFV